MPLVEVRNQIYPVKGNQVPVEWASFDFSQDVAGIPNELIRKALTETGVMYLPSQSPAIRVSHLLPIKLQGLSALHEELCMNQQVAPCTDVETQVIESVTDDELRNSFIDVRLRMFGALCIMNPENEVFAATRTMLQDMHAEL